MDTHRLPSSEERQSSARGDMSGMDQGMRVLSYLIAGVLLYGGLGWLGDRYLGTGFLLPVGIVLGAAAGCYVIIRRYGQVPPVGAVLGPVSTDSISTDTVSTGDVSTGNDQTTTNQKREGAR